MSWKQCWFVVLMVAGMMVSPVWAEDDEENAAGNISYIELSPPFVTNYGGPGRLRYLRASVSLRVKGGENETNAVRRHTPQIRHIMVMLLSRQSDEAINSVEGRNAIREQALQQVNEMLLAEEGKSGVEDLLFMDFIVQR